MILLEGKKSAYSRFVSSGKLTEDQFEKIYNLLSPFDPSQNQKYIEQLFNYYLQATPKDRKDNK
jgi:hypothetical protein